MKPEDLFFCEKYRCTLTARACVLMQKKRFWIKRGTLSRGLTPTYCVSGKCRQGHIVWHDIKGQYIAPPLPLRRRSQKPPNDGERNQS